MPMMPRIKHSLATKIAHKILGLPVNMLPKKPKPEDLRIKRRLAFEDSSRVK